MPRPTKESRPIGPAFAAFLAAVAGYWLALVLALWLPLQLLGRGLGPLRVIGALLMPGLLILGAFAGALAQAVAKRALMPAPLLADETAHALIRMMAYAYGAAALHAAVLGAVAAFRASPGDRR